MFALKYLMDEIRSVILLTFLSAIGGLLFGYDTGVVSGAMLLIEEDSRIEADTVWKELIVSATVRSRVYFINMLHRNFYACKMLWRSTPISPTLPIN